MEMPSQSGYLWMKHQLDAIDNQLYDLTQNPNMDPNLRAIAIGDVWRKVRGLTNLLRSYQEDGNDPNYNAVPRPQANPGHVDSPAG